MKISSLSELRKKAKSEGKIKFSYGEPCKHGHVSERYTSSGWCVECVRIFNKGQRLKHKGKSHPATVKWRKENREKHISYNKRWNSENLERIREREAERRKTDRSYKTKKQCQNMLHRTLRLCGKTKTTKTELALGYTSADLLKSISSKLRDGMTWDNFGRGPGHWNIDHIKPIAAFVKEGVSDPSVINALSNLQPLWFEENSEKRDKYEEQK